MVTFYYFFLHFAICFLKIFIFCLFFLCFLLFLQDSILHPANFRFFFRIFAETPAFRRRFLVNIFSFCAFCQKLPFQSGRFLPVTHKRCVPQSGAYLSRAGGAMQSLCAGFVPSRSASALKLFRTPAREKQNLVLSDKRKARNAPRLSQKSLLISFPYCPPRTSAGR